MSPTLTRSLPLPASHTHALTTHSHRCPASLLVTQLSGGERSYTTVAFTLALGAMTEMPFRAMDEFDVVGRPALPSPAAPAACSMPRV